MKRPIGMTVVAALAILGGVHQSAQGLAVMRVLLATLPPSLTDPKTWVVFASGIPVVWGVGLGAAGIGLWKLRRWARLLLIGLCSLALVYGGFVFMLGYFIPDFSIVSLFPRYPWPLLLRLAFCGLCVGSMFTSEAKRAFKDGKPETLKP